MLICSGSTLLMLVSLILAGGITVLNGTTERFGDPARLAAQVVSGIGFLGGGAIIRQGFNIKGLTTAATIWVAAAIGLAIGVGAYTAAGVTLLCVLTTLIFLEQFEARIFPSKSVKTLHLIYDVKDFNYVCLQEELNLLKIAVENVDISHTMESDHIKLSIRVHVPAHIDFILLTETLKRAGNLRKLELVSNEKSP